MANGAAVAAASSQPKPERGRRNPLLFVTESGVFKFFILACIVVNSIMLGYDAHNGPDNPYSAQIARWDDIFLYIFTAELALEFLAQGPRKWVRSGWNWFDVVIVGMSWVSSMPGVTALRAFRVIRVFRLVSNVPQMQRVVEALMKAMPGIAATTSILAIVYYIGAIMATTFFGERFPVQFGDLGKSALVLFQLTLFDDWGAIVSEIGSVYPWAWAFFLTFTVVSAFAVLNLFIGVIVDAVQEARSAEMRKEVQHIEGEVEGIAEAQLDAAALQRLTLSELRALRAEIAVLRSGGAPPSG